MGTGLISRISGQNGTRKLGLSPFFYLLLMLVAVTAFRRAWMIQGDGFEYATQTQAIALHGRLSIDPELARRDWARGGLIKDVPEPLPPVDKPFHHQYPFGGLYRDLRGDYRYYHFWGYSLAVAPLYMLLRLLSPSPWPEILSFRLMNLVFLFVPLLLAWRRRPGLPLLLMVFLLLVSPLTPYVDWQHPELYCFFLVFTAFWTAARPSWSLVSPLLLGLAAAQNVPILFFFPALGLWTARSAAEARGGAPRLVPAAYALGLFLAAIPLLHAKHFFGVWSPLAATGQARLAYASLARTADIFLHPMIGAVWFFPAVFFFIPAWWRRRRAAATAAVLAGMAAAAWLSGATVNLNAAQIGATRYAVWLATPLAFFLLETDWEAVLRRRAGRLLFAGGLAAVLLTIAFFRTEMLPLRDSVHLVNTQRANSRTAMIYRLLPWYTGDIEVLAENLTHAEFLIPRHFDGVYIWNLGRGESLWVVSRRAVTRGRGLFWETGGAAPAWRAYPPARVFVPFAGGLRLDRAAVTRYLRHPVLGDYLVVRAEAEARRVVSRAPVFIHP